MSFSFWRRPRHATQGPYCSMDDAHARTGCELFLPNSIIFYITIKFFDQMFHGQCMVNQDKILLILQTVQLLKVRGLCEIQNKDGDTATDTNNGKSFLAGFFNSSKIFTLHPSSLLISISVLLQALLLTSKKLHHHRLTTQHDIFLYSNRSCLNRWPLQTLRLSL